MAEIGLEGIDVLTPEEYECRHGIVFTVRWRSQASDFGDINGEIDASNVAESYRCDSKPPAFNAPVFAAANLPGLTECFRAL